LIKKLQNTKTRGDEMLHYKNMITTDISKTINIINKFKQFEEEKNLYNDIIDRIMKSTALTIWFDDIFSKILKNTNSMVKDILNDDYYNEIFMGGTPVFGKVIERIGYRFVKEVLADKIHIYLRDNNNKNIQMNNYISLPQFEDLIDNKKDNKDEILKSLKFNVPREQEEFEYIINDMFLIIINKMVESIKAEIYSKLDANEENDYDFEPNEASKFNELA
jgi:hypothetical protein